MKTAKATITAATTKNPVLSCLESMGFSYLTKGRNFFVMTHIGKGKPILSFFISLNRKLGLHKDSPKNSPFHPPVFSGKCVTSSAKINGILYKVDITAGTIHVTVLKP